jgi:hypothetical protein
MTTYRLLIEIEYALPNWPLVDFRKEELGKESAGNTYKGFYRFAFENEDFGLKARTAA